MIDTIKMNNGINVKVNKGDIKISIYDIEENIKELFEFKKKYNKGEKILLSNICNCMYDLLFCGRNKETKEMLFRLC